MKTIYSDSAPHTDSRKERFMLWRKEHIPTIAIWMAIGLVAAWALFFFPAFGTMDGLNN